MDEVKVQHGMDHTAGGPFPDCLGPLLSAAMFRDRIITLADEYTRMYEAIGRPSSQNEHGLGPMTSVLMHGTSLSTTRIASRSDWGTSMGASPRKGEQQGNGWITSVPSIDALPENREESDEGDWSKMISFENLAAPTDKSPTSSGTDKPINKKKVLRLRSVSAFSLREKPALFVAQSTLFEKVMAVVILMNVAFIGFSADQQIQDMMSGRGDRNVILVHWVEGVFCLAYIIELAIRLTAYRKDFFFDPHDKWWNIFDMLLAIQNILELVGAYILDMASIQQWSLSFLRGVRLLKMVKMLRVVRLMRSMREMRMILYSTMGCMRSLLWSLVLLMMVLYMFGLIFVQSILNYCEELEDPSNGNMDSELLDYWGSVPKAMVTLFMSSCGGIDWHDALDPLYEVGIAFVLLFLLYVAVFTFVILNTVTALFVENTLATANKDFQSSIQIELEKKEEYVESLRLLFEEMDERGRGEMSLEVFEEQIANPKLVAFFASLELEITDAAHFFEMLSDYGKKKVTLDTFVTGCIRMRGQALAVDLHYLTSKQALMHNELVKFMQRSEIWFDMMQRKFAWRQPAVDVPECDIKTNAQFHHL